SLEQLQRSHSPDGLLPELIQADASYLPLRDERFDRVLSVWMLQHLPTEQARRRAVQEMARVLKPGGLVLLTVYNYGLERRRAGRRSGTGAKQGYHSDAQVPFFAFTADELARLVGERFRVLELCGTLNYWPFARRVPDALRVRIDAALERLPLSRLLG